MVGTQNPNGIEIGAGPSINGTPSQIDSIWQKRKNWDLVINYEDKEIPHKLKKARDKITIVLDSCDKKLWGDLIFKFTPKSKRADEVLQPLKYNGMSIKTGFCTISKNKIILKKKKM